MHRRSHKTEFAALLIFLAGVALVITNGFSARIFAQDQEREVFETIEPIGDVLAEVMQNYVGEPNMDLAVERALIGIMSSLDKNSSYIPPEGFKAMQEDTEGEFEGIGVIIRFSEEEQHIYVAQPMFDMPAMKAGIRIGDIITEVDGVPTADVIEGSMNWQEALEKISQRIKGPRGTSVDIQVLRQTKAGESYLDFEVKRGRIPVPSIEEARLLNGGIGYIRVHDFKKNTDQEIKNEIRAFGDDLNALILDLRWNPGGLLTASREVCDLFLPKDTLVTATRGRQQANGRYIDDMKLYTERPPAIPETMPLIVLVSWNSASSSEIVTGALQYHERALIVGEKTFGKGSVQTIIPLRRPEGSAIRLTTARYYTPGGITIDEVGILPDVEVEMDRETQDALRIQLAESYGGKEDMRNQQNHGSVTGNPVEEETVEDVVLARAVQMLREEPVFANLLKKYHRDVHETQVAAEALEARQRP